MLSASRLVTAARAALMLAGPTVAVLVLGPFQGAEKAFLLSDKEAHAIAFFAMTALAYLAAPRCRRSDLAFVAIALGAAVEIAQSFTGRSASLMDLLADCIGVFFAYAPSEIERIRGLARSARADAPLHLRRRGDLAQPKPAPMEALRL